jgi:DNA invertase Pin-like site-specific DNA recombinase
LPGRAHARIPHLDRLGRDLRHLVNLVHELTSRGVGLKILTG